MTLKRSLTIEDIYGPEASWGGLSLQGFTWDSDGSAFMYMDKEQEGDSNNIYREQIDDRKRTIVVNGKSLVFQAGSEPVPISGFQVTDDGRYYLIAGPLGQPRLRYTAAPRERSYYLYEAATGAFRPLSSIAGGQMYPKFSPDGGKLGFVRGGNLFLIDLDTGFERQITFDGGGNILAQGHVNAGEPQGQCSTL